MTWEEKEHWRRFFGLLELAVIDHRTGSAFIPARSPWPAPEASVSGWRAVFRGGGCE